MEGAAPHRRSILLLLAATGVGALLAWVVSRARGRRPGEPPDYATETTGAPDAGVPSPTGLDGNVLAVTTQWLPARQRDLVGFTAGGERDTVDPAAPHTPGIDGARGIPSEGRLSGPTLLGVAAVIGLVAVGLGTWAFASRDARTRTVTVTVSRSPQRGERVGDRVNPVPNAVSQALTLVASRSTERIPLAHSVGRIVLVVDPRGRALLVVHDLGKAPAGKSYQAWVIPPKTTVPVSAAVFGGAELVVTLRPVVAPGAAVAVTLERAGGAPTPSHAPTLVAKRSV